MTDASQATDLANKERTMEDPERDEPTATAEDADDLDLQPDEAEAVKGGATTSGGTPMPPPLRPGG
jgi:hypothetical protein